MLGWLAILLPHSQSGSNMPKSQYPQINVRVDGDFLKRVDAWRRDQPDLPNRPEAIRRLVELALAAKTKPRRGTPA
jgi:hypothetical protein